VVRERAQCRAEGAAGGDPPVGGQGQRGRGGAQHRALWNPRTRLLRIELDGQQSIEVHDVHTPSAELDNRDLVPGPTITDETGVKITPIREV
jgi:hypothetical protein